MCNCKQDQKQKSKPTPVKVSKQVQDVKPKTPGFTIEEIERAKNYFKNEKKTNGEANWVIEFHNTNWSMDYPLNYVGNGWKIIEDRINILDQRLKEYQGLTNN